MTDAHEPNELPLSDALIRWTDPRLVAAVCADERRHPAPSLQQFYRTMKELLQICSDADLDHTSDDRDRGRQPDTLGLLNAWRALERDLRQRIERGVLHLRGVRVAPARERHRSVIESLWAAEFEFDFHVGRIRVGDAAYVGVVAVRGPAPDEVDVANVTPSPNSKAPVITQITQTTVRDLSDEEVLLLLEEHARRVVANETYKTLDPGITKVTFMPLILRKMRARAAAGELLDTMRAEAAALATWIQQKAPSYQTPTAGTIENSLRNEYRHLKA